MKSERLLAIQRLIGENRISGQEELLKMLQKQGFTTTQATLSRDIRRLKIVKMPDSKGNYAYSLPTGNLFSHRTAAGQGESELLRRGFVSYDFSGQLCVIKTRPGYANGIASEIDGKAHETVLGTIAGDDTILLIPREGVGRGEISTVLSQILSDV
ncbi:MAG: arginine repressor [Dysgonamonadaceae bacterium]|jgi:transcriptional regulator of arginine metabolism|nr:arginine repressor [Dysgonamonadaceae bacterium]